MPSVKIDETTPKEVMWGNSIRIDEPPKHSVRVMNTPERQTFWGEFFRDPEKFMPFFGSIELADQMRNYYYAAERLQNNSYDDVPEVGAINSQEKFANMPIEMAEVSAFEMAYGDHPRWTPEAQRENDLQLLNEFQDKFAKDPSFAGTVGKILGEMPAFMAEFAATGGMVSLGRKGTETLLKRVVLKGTEMSIQAGLRTALNPGRLALAYENRRLPSNMTVDEDGNISFDWTVENPYMSFTKAVGDVYIEMLSEETGEGITKGLGFVANKLPFFRKLSNSLYSKWIKLHPKANWSDFIKKMSTRVGYHGIIGEVGEEYLGDSLRAITNVDDFGAGKDSDMFERLGAAVETDVQNTPAMLVSFAVPGVTRAAISIPGARKQSKRAKQYAEVQKMYEQIAGLEINSPSEIMTAEGMLGMELDGEVPEYTYTSEPVWEDVYEEEVKGEGIEVYRTGDVPSGGMLLHFGSEGAAKQIAKGETGRVRRGYLNIKKPATMVDSGRAHDKNPVALAEDLVAGNNKGIDPSLVSVIRMIQKTKGDKAAFEGIRNALKNHGYDGISYTNVNEDKGSTSYVALDASQFSTYTEPVKTGDKEITGYKLKKVKTAKAVKDPKFREAGLATKLGLTPKWLTNRILGIEPMLEDVTSAFNSQELERANLTKWSDKIIKQIKKLKHLPSTMELNQERINKILSGEEETELPLWELSKLNQFRDKLGAKQTPVSIMRDLLDTYEEAPEWLDKDSKRIFNQVRELTNYLLARANSVRARMGLPLINKVEGYITHWLDAITRKSLEDAGHLDELQKAGYTSPAPGWLKKILPGIAKKMENPYQKHREASKLINQYFSKDLGALLKTMINYDLRDIYLLEPYHAATEELSRLRQSNLIPQGTYNEVLNYLLYDIRKFKTPTDEAFNATVKKPVDFINKILTPFGKIIYDPSRSIMGTMRRMGYLSGLGFRIKPGLRNLGQRMLLLDLYRGVDIGRAQAVQMGLAEMPNITHPITGEQVPLMEYIKEQDWYKLTFSRFEDIITTLTGLETKGLGWYSRTHQLNVNIAVLTGYFDWLHNYNLSQDKNTTHAKDCAIQAKKLGIPVQQLLTNESDMMWSIREAVRRTQWEYFSTSMPGIYRGEVARTTFMFQSWWMNYFFNHVRECFLQTTTGRNSRGRLLPPGARYRALKGMGSIVAMGRAAETAFKVKVLGYLFMPFPGYLPPVLDLIAGITTFFAAYDDDKKRKAAAKKIMKSLEFWIPFSVGGKELFDLLSGEKDISDYLLYTKPEKK